MFKGTDWMALLCSKEGVMKVTMFSNFTMKLEQFFSEPQRRKANEGVQILHLNPETRMNSKDEFLQGTNIFMQPLRGAGVWGVETQGGEGRPSTPGEASEGGTEALVVGALTPLV